MTSIDVTKDLHLHILDHCIPIHKWDLFGIADWIASVQSEWE